jgi:hypothetical protein
MRLDARLSSKRCLAQGTAASAATDAKSANGPTSTSNSLPPQTAEPVGLRYSLPKPFLLVTPNAKGDGAFTAEVIYLPDENATYAIDASTRRGKYSLDVQVKDGLLAKVAWTAANAAVAAESAPVAGELVKAQLADEQKDPRRA